MKFRLEGTFRLTSEERKIFLWLRENRNTLNKIKCSAKSISLQFNFSDTKVQRLLGRIEDKGLIEILIRGVGRKPNLYRIYEISPRQIVLVGKHKKKLKSENENPEAENNSKSSNPGLLCHFGKNGYQEVQKNLSHRIYNYNRIDSNNIYLQREARPGLYAIERSPNTSALIKPLKLLSSRSMLTPHKRFKKKFWNPEVWNAHDIICYYSEIYKGVYGSWPALNWRVDGRAAKILLEKFEDGGESVKRLLQLGFQITPENKSPNSLRWFTQSWVINTILQNQDKDITMYELGDDVVFANLR